MRNKRLFFLLRISILHFPKMSQITFDAFAFGPFLTTFEMTNKVVLETSDFPFKIEH